MSTELKLIEGSPILSRIIRALPDFRSVKGGLKALLHLCGPTRSPNIDYTVNVDGGLRFFANPKSYIEWNILYFGNYEGQEISLFRDFCLKYKGGILDTILDVGANIGNHSLRFATFTRTVYSFEPNPTVSQRLHANIRLNGQINIKVREFGLGLHDAVLPFYAPTVETGSDNLGTGTFVLAEASNGSTHMQLQIRNGDAVVREEVVGRIDAIKIDVQGFEAEVLRGLETTLTQHCPVIWFEVSGSTAEAIADLGGMSTIIPFEHDLYKFKTRSRLGVLHRLSLEPWETADRLDEGDYVVVPRQTLRGLE
jgi:FkbM family methyltransferase